jgi:hypothetical protein
VKLNLKLGCPNFFIFRWQLRHMDEQGRVPVHPAVRAGDR